MPPHLKMRQKVQKQKRGHIKWHQTIDSYNFIELLIQNGTDEALAPQRKQQGATRCP